jgi:type IX secretion system PorP/SprF family membrane protein
VLRRILWILTFAIVVLDEVQAQYDPSFSHYWAMETYFNPGAAGKQEKINVAVAYNMTLTGFQNNPKTMYASADLPFYLIGAYHGVGAKFVNDKIGLFSHNSFALQYAFKLKLLGGVLSIGVQPTFIGENFDGSKLELEEGNDPTFTTSQLTGSAFDMDAGLYYSQRNWYAGASVMHALAPTVEMGETNELQLSRSYYFTAGGNIRLRNPFLSIQPSVLGRTDGVAYRADITGRLTYQHEKKMMYAGIGYSPTNSVTVYIGGFVHGIILGYSYEAYTNGVSLGNGSHELLVGYQTDLNLFKKGRNRHQSVRLL